MEAKSCKEVYKAYLLCRWTPKLNAVLGWMGRIIIQKVFNFYIRQVLVKFHTALQAFNHSWGIYRPRNTEPSRILTQSNTAFQKNLNGLIWLCQLITHCWVLPQRPEGLSAFWLLLMLLEIVELLFKWSKLSFYNILGLQQTIMWITPQPCWGNGWRTGRTATTTWSGGQRRSQGWLKNIFFQNRCLEHVNEH